MKTCSQCGDTKPLDQFSKMAKCRDGLRPYCKACAAKAHQKNKARHNVLTTEWRKKNPEKRKAIKAKSYLAHKDEISKRSAAAYAADPEKFNARIKDYQTRHPEVIRTCNHNRRARKLAAGGTLSRGLFDRLFELQKGRCAVCRVALVKADPHMDHKMPLALGGENTDDNIQLLCGTCNRVKGAKHPIEFMQSKGFLL